MLVLKVPSLSKNREFKIHEKRKHKTDPLGTATMDFNPFSNLLDPKITLLEESICFKAKDMPFIKVDRLAHQQRVSDDKSIAESG